MRIRIVGLTACLIFSSFISLQAANNPFIENSALSKIENDYANGSISLDEKVILQVNSIKYPNKLPIQYSSSTQIKTESELRGATLALIQMRADWELLEESTKNYVSLALARASTEFTYISPGGYFKMHYDTAGVDSVPSEDLDLDSIPDYVERCAAYCDTGLAKSLEIGFMYPPNDGVYGGDSLYDVYFQEMSYYGYTVPEGFGSNPWNDYYSYLVLNNDFIGFPSNTDPEGQVAGAAKATAAHEFHHAVQFGYDANEDLWAMESGAVFMEEVVYDTVNDNYNYIDDFMDFPHTSLMDNAGLHKYGAFLWPLYLAQKFDTLLYVSVWEGAKYDDIFTAYADTLLNNFGWDIDSAYVDFTYWLFNSGVRDDGIHFSESSEYSPLAIGATHISYPIGITNSPASVGGYGSSFITFYPGSEIGKLKITFNGSNTRNWTAYVIKSTTQNSHEIEFITLDSISKRGELIITNFESYYSITLVGVNTDEFSSSVLFTYSAEIILPYEVSSQILTPDSAVYSGGVRTFDILIRNDAIINDIFNLIYWDNQGWLPMDTFALAIAAGDSAVINVDVTPPQGTPLGENSILFFKSESWGDTAVYDILERTGQIDLYRGDVDFSGSIDISDIVALVDYSFNGGLEPQPILLSGDFDCSNAVDISDIVDLVSYMFDGGDYSPCNPY